MISTTTAFWDKYDGDGVTTDFPLTTAVKYLATPLVQVRVLQDDDTIVEDGGTGYAYTVDTTLKQVEFTTAPLSTDTIYIYPDVTVNQLIDFINGAALTAENIETGLDKLTVLSAQILFELNRAIKYELPDADDALVVAYAADMTEKYLYCDENGDLTWAALSTTALTVSAFMESVMALASAATVRTALEVYSETETDAAIDADVAVLAGTGHTTETVKDNADDIATNASDISTNASDISTNASDISSLEDLAKLMVTNGTTLWASSDSGSTETSIADTSFSASIASGDVLEIELRTGTVGRMDYIWNYSPWSLSWGTPTNVTAITSLTGLCTLTLATDTISTSAGVIVKIERKNA